MHLLQDFLLWSLISGLVIGGALAFHRFFPDESPWFGLMVPPVAFVLLINFIEHFIALPDLLILLPILAGILLWLVAAPGYNRRNVFLPACIFLGAFAFTFGIRCLQPDILHTSDGLSDLNKINNFCQGDILPPIDTWMPPFHYVWYYSLQHYAASIIQRLFDIKIGAAYNATHALLSALICVAGAAAAHRLSGGRTWITVMIPFLITAAATGSSAYIYLTSHDPSEWLASNLSGGVIAYDNAIANHTPPDGNPLWKLLALVDPHRERLELQVPGFWTWRDEYHANASGHFLTLFAVFVIAELVAIRRTIWPWIMAVLLPFLAVDSSTWSYPIITLLCGGTVVLALYFDRRPAALQLAGLILLAAFVLLWPSFHDVTSSPQVPDIVWTQSEWRAPFLEFIIQWWPILALWVLGCCYFRELSFGMRWILCVIPLMLIGVELITVEGRYNTIEKMWGYTYGTGLIALFPIVARLANWEAVGAYLHEEWAPARLFHSSPAKGLWDRIGDLTLVLTRPTYLACRFVTVLLVFSAAVSLYGRLRTECEWIPWNGGVGAIEGDHYITIDPQKNRIMQILRQVKHKTFLSGKVVWCYNESPAPAVFTGNRSYIAWTYFESVADYPEESNYRTKLANDFYSGALPDRLKFLQGNHIAGVIIWPDDAIPDDYLAALKKELDSAYEYVDCRGDGDKNAGVFLQRPLPEK